MTQERNLMKMYARKLLFLNYMLDMRHVRCLFTAKERKKNRRQRNISLFYCLLLDITPSIMFIYIFNLANVSHTWRVTELG